MVKINSSFVCVTTCCKRHLSYSLILFDVFFDANV